MDDGRISPRPDIKPYVGYLIRLTSCPYRVLTCVDYSSHSWKVFLASWALNIEVHINTSLNKKWSLTAYSISNFNPSNSQSLTESRQ